MDVEVSVAEDSALIALTGELDLSTAPDLILATDRLLGDDACHTLALDLSGLRFIDSSGINALLQIRKAAQETNTSLRLARLSARVAEVLRLTAVDHLFEITGP